MSKAWRRITYLSFFILFFVFSPLFIFYSLGYRYNFDKNIIEKNGAFFIKSYPRGTSIFIDKNKTRHKTPSQLTNVKPGQHLIELKKDGFITWYKQLPVATGETTFIEDVALFLEEKVKTITSDGGDYFIVNKQKNKYAHLSDQTLWLTNTDQARSFEIFKFKQATQIIDWSPDDQQLLIKQNGYKIFDINQQEIKAINIYSPDKIVWDNQNENFIWFSRNQILYRHNIALGTDVIKVRDVDNFDLTGEYLVTQGNQENNAQITQWEKDSTKQIRQLDNLHLGTLKIILADADYLIFMLGSQVYIQRPFAELFKIPALFVEIYGKYLLINDGHQTTLYDYNNDIKEIIDRSSQIVSDIKWHPNGSYFINEIEGLTTIYELDSRNYRNNDLFLDDPLKKMYLFNEKGDELYILTPEENFYLTIQ
jgi:hypothetical protein